MDNDLKKHYSMAYFAGNRIAEKSHNAIVLYVLFSIYNKKIKSSSKKRFIDELL
jgi:hypothetical protein